MDIDDEIADWKDLTPEPQFGLPDDPYTIRTCSFCGKHACEHLSPDVEAKAALMKAFDAVDVLDVVISLTRMPSLIFPDKKEDMRLFVIKHRMEGASIRDDKTDALRAANYCLMYDGPTFEEPARPGRP